MAKDNSDNPNKASDDCADTDAVETKQERLEAIGKTASKAFANIKESKQVNHDLPEVIVIKELSELSQDVFDRFGIEAPGLLNDYCCALEDALIEQNARLHEHKSALETIDIARKQLDLENSLLHRRLNLIAELVNRKQVGKISELMTLPLSDYN